MSRPTSSSKPGDSYLGFPCANCRAPLPVFTIRADVATPRVTLSGNIELRCPQCHHTAVYEPAQITRFEQAQMH
jgi:hypothetical protein